MEQAGKIEWLEVAEGTTNKPGLAGGVILPASYCAEQEEGIQPLWTLFKIADDPKITGPARYKVQAVPPQEYITFKKGRTWAKLIVGEYQAVATKPKNLDGEEMRGEWDAEAFALSVAGKANILRLEQIHKALLSQNAAIWLGGAGENPFARAGLVICIYDQIRPEAAETMQKGHENANALQAAADGTGIESKLKATHGKERFDFSGCRWYALAPAWTKTIAGKTTQHPVIFFLNPCNQKDYNHGWFTVEELEQWIEGKGPIIKKKPEAEAKAQESPLEVGAPPMRIRTRTVLFNGAKTAAELRVYVEPFNMAQLPALKTEVLATFQKVGVQPTDEQLGLYSNRAGLHFYCIVEGNPGIWETLKQAGWKEAKN